LAEVLAILFESPLYFAVMTYVPGAENDVVSFATFPLSEAVPRVWEPEVKVTEPDGAPPYCEVTVAV
jgi:hypothetical protein